MRVSRHTGVRSSSAYVADDPAATRMRRVSVPSAYFVALVRMTQISQQSRTNSASIGSTQHPSSEALTIRQRRQNGGRPRTQGLDRISAPNRRAKEQAQE